MWKTSLIVLCLMLSACASTPQPACPKPTQELLEPMPVPKSIWRYPSAGLSMPAQTGPVSWPFVPDDSTGLSNDSRPLKIVTVCGEIETIRLNMYPMGVALIHEQPWKWTSADERKIIDAVRAAGGAEIIPGEAVCI